MPSFVYFGLMAAGEEEQVETAELEGIVEAARLEVKVATAVEESDCHHFHCHPDRRTQA